jgi:hypothetical protein
MSTFQDITLKEFKAAYSRLEVIERELHYSRALIYMLVEALGGEVDIYESKLIEYTERGHHVLIITDKGDPFDTKIRLKLETKT